MANYKLEGGGALRKAEKGNKENMNVLNYLYIN